MILCLLFAAHSLHSHHWPILCRACQMRNEWTPAALFPVISVCRRNIIFFYFFWWDLSSWHFESSCSVCSFFPFLFSIDWYNNDVLGWTLSNVKITHLIWSWACRWCSSISFGSQLCLSASPWREKSCWLEHISPALLCKEGKTTYSALMGEPPSLGLVGLRRSLQLLQTSRPRPSLTHIRPRSLKILYLCCIWLHIIKVGSSLCWFSAHVS